MSTCPKTLQGYSAECRNDFRQSNPLATLAAQVTIGNTLMETKTIYNIKGKTNDQIGWILTGVQDQFLLKHPDFEYSDLKYEDGKQGERKFFLIFKRKTSA